MDHQIEHPELPTMFSTSELSRLISLPSEIPLLSLPNFTANSKDVPQCSQSSFFSLPTDPLTLFQLQMGLLPMLQPMNVNGNIQFPLLGQGMDQLNLSLLQNQLMMSSTTPSTTRPTSSTPTHSTSTVSSTQCSLPEPTLTVPSPERRRKRSRASAEPQMSVLRMLCEEDDVEVIKVPKTDEDFRTRANSLISAKKTESPVQKAPSESDLSKPLRRIFRDQDLPETVGPDSPFRHHPKYQQKRQDPETELLKEFEAITALVMVNGIMPQPLVDKKMENEREKSISPRNGTKGTSPIPDSPKKNECPMQEFMDQVISRELVTCE